VTFVAGGFDETRESESNGSADDSGGRETSAIFARR